MTAISTTKDVANILFFLATVILATMTYWQAKKTIFTPFRTEAFKLQLKALEDVLVFFEKHPTTNIDDQFDFDNIVRLNAHRLLDSYALAFFRADLDLEKLAIAREALDKERVGAIVNQEFMEQHFAQPTHLGIETSRPTEEAPTNPAIILARWMEYKHGMVEYTARFDEASERLRRFRVSPLLPTELKELIRAFEKTVTENLRLIGQVMTAIAKELPQKFPSVASLQKANLGWIWNEYNHNRTLLSDNQNAVLTFVSDYLQIDTLLSKKE